MTEVAVDQRLEAAARGLARHLLAGHSYSPALTAELVDELRGLAEERLWPKLLEEARAALIAADGTQRPESAARAGEASVNPSLVT